jgi:hypothetical protein
MVTKMTTLTQNGAREEENENIEDESDNIEEETLLRRSTCPTQPSTRLRDFVTYEV